MATKKYVSFSNLSSFLDNLKGLFATKTEMSAKSDKTHFHAISDITNLQSALNGKASASHGTHVTYSATTPLMDGTASVGIASTVARSDHKHPTDTSRASQTSLDSHTSNSTTHITSTERSNWNSAYAHSQSAHAPSNAEANQNAFSNVKIGDVTIAADIKTDTLTLVAGDNITITPDATNDKITISAKDTTYSLSSFGVTSTAAELNKLDGVTATATEINYVDGVTSNIQNQLDNKAAKSHTHTVSSITDLTATATELNYMDGVKSNVQTQLDGKSASGHTHNYAGSSSVGGAATSANKLNTNAGSATQPVYFKDGVPVATSYKLEKSVPSSAVFTDSHYTSKNVVGATNATSNTSTALTNGNVYLNSVENGAVTSSHKISGSGATTVTTDANGNIVISSTDNNTTYSAAGSALGLVKSGGDVTISSGVITVNDDSHNHTIANVDNLQSSLDAKQATVTGGASTITSSNLTANRALISNDSGKVAVSAVTSTELGYLDGVTSNVQTQLDGKSGTSHTHSYAGSSSVGGSAASAVKLDTSTAGDANTPVYFTGGKPVACTSLDLNTSGSSASCTGNSATATKLQTARTIALGTGATGTATSFNGTGNITIPVTDVKESYLSWGGKNLVGSVSPISVALSTEHSANRLAYLNPDAIKVEYSNNAGSTWTDSGLGNSGKINFVTTSNSISVGSNSTVTTSHRTRITLTAQDGTTGYVYTRPRKMLINVSTAGHGLTVAIEAKTGASDASWKMLGTYELSGWSGWNDIPVDIGTFGGGTNKTGNYWYIRLTFANTSVNSSYTTTKSSIIGLRLFGDTCWTRTSNMGETGHLYSYDASQNATFPANITATEFSGAAFSGNGIATVSEVKSYLGI